MCYLLLSHSKTILGESRGFAFVTFSTIDEARMWLEKKKVDARSSGLIMMMVVYGSRQRERKRFKAFIIRSETKLHTI